MFRLSPPWIAGLSLFVLFEKLSPFGERGDRVAGALLLIAVVGLAASTRSIG